MDVNENANILDKRVACNAIVGTPPGASSLLQMRFRQPCRAKGRIPNGGMRPGDVS